MHVGSGASLTLVATSGENIITLQGPVADFTITREVATIAVTGTGGEQVSFTARTTAQTLVFWDGAAEVVITGNNVLLGNQVIEQGAPQDITAELEANTTATGAFITGDRLRGTDVALLSMDDLQLLGNSGTLAQIDATIL